MSDGQAGEFLIHVSSPVCVFRIGAINRRNSCVYRAAFDPTSVSVVLCAISLFVCISASLALLNFSLAVQSLEQHAVGLRGGLDNFSLQQASWSVELIESVLLLADGHRPQLLRSGPLRKPMLCCNT